jgi:uncharacterized protein (TIGR03435 family)
MQRLTRLGFVVLLGLVVASSASHVAAQRRATTTVTRLYTGTDGQSHAEDIEVAWRPANLRAELSDSESVKVTGAQFLRWPRGFVWAGHPASKRQYVIIVSGRGEVDVVGGKVPLAPGRVLLAEDVTGKGHTTRVGPDEDLVMLLVPLAQERAAGPTFDVVSIKRNTSVIGPGYRSNFVTWRPDGGVTMTNVTVSGIISRAYPGIVPADMVGLPAWDRSERFDVSATSSLARATPDDRAAMVRGMLEDRFKLVLHVEKRQQPAYELVFARGDGRLGPGLKRLDVDCAAVNAARAAEAEAALAAGTPPAQAPRQPTDFNAPPPPCSLRSFPVAMRNRSADLGGQLTELLLEGETTLDNLAASLRLQMGRRVINKTGLAGSYRVTMNFDGASGRGGPALTAPDGAAPSIFTAMAEQLGLKLEGSRFDLDTLVIDRVDRPTEN